MNIVIVTDDGYVQHAAVMLTSLFESNSSNRFHIFVFTNDISGENYSRLERLCAAYGNSISVHYPEKELLHNSNIDIMRLNSGGWSKMIYHKLFMPLILPKSVERCLFLDVDMVIVDDLAPLYNIKMVDYNIIAAVEDLLSCIPRKKALGLAMSDLYINSGVMVCDIEQWRKEEKRRPIFDFVYKWSDRVINEQDVIAAYMKGRIQLIPIRWNMVGCNYLRKKNVFPKYYEELTNARRHPAIHHFCTLIPPWYADSPHPFRKLYIKFLKIYAEKIGISVNLHLPYKNMPKSHWQKLRHVIANVLNFMDIIRQPGYVLHKWKY
ncbi:Lipopolysaccharide biosynthesis protein, LPS:glycosyltransferase [Bacteroides faecichinchillae]|uniref:Lipopolysaccharide biosynthesis protein, LPS:glycosyltransferase n=1 Tax=Bacteroides faecichinchillae TaxID=871325 RepID=A0A1M4YY04_9BACE|nr:glycosyltransferase family 8 protein [Bacteroides faecichinchillae]SHF10709.1 Lipopolysaccharide biosynthesis protein, LPS:glycosyltransferase [Bacteroides faecichinchillae]